MPSTASNRLYGLLDSLVALRMEFANGTHGDNDLSPLGREKVMEVRAILDAAIESTKRAIGDMDQPHPRNGAGNTRLQPRDG
jgi:hypothetical protein